jgi:hypothetical protein
MRVAYIYKYLRGIRLNLLEFYYPLPNLPPREKETISRVVIVSPLGEIRKGVNDINR